jgi:hypothetical protein
MLIDRAGFLCKIFQFVHNRVGIFGPSCAGEWLDDRREGFGEYFYTNGDHYVGEWRNHARHGRGRYTYASAAVQYDGNWINGHRVHNDVRRSQQTDAVGAAASSVAEAGRFFEMCAIREIWFSLNFNTGCLAVRFVPRSLAFVAVK